MPRDPPTQVHWTRSPVEHRSTRVQFKRGTDADTDATLDHVIGITYSIYYYSLFFFWIVYLKNPYTTLLRNYQGVFFIYIYISILPFIFLIECEFNRSSISFSSIFIFSSFLKTKEGKNTMCEWRFIYDEGTKKTKKVWFDLFTLNSTKSHDKIKEHICWKEKGPIVILK